MNCYIFHAAGVCGDEGPNLATNVLRGGGNINIVTDDKYFEKVDKDQNLSYLHDYKFTLIAKTPAGLELLIWVCVRILLY